MVQESDVTTEKEAGPNLTVGQANSLEEKEQTIDDIANIHETDICDNKPETNGLQPKDAEEFDNPSNDDQLKFSKKSCLESQCKMKNEDQNNVQYFKCPSLNCNLSFELSLV